MNEIRAFIGHSFNPDDEGVVRRFLDYFGQVAKSHPNFSWEHAQQAEPKVLTEKVLKLIEGKNTFIAICTRSEKVIVNTPEKTPGLIERFFGSRERQFVWKTSDWIIQEIGLAVGKNLNLVLFIEDGVRRPGGLQGDLEYISFNRENIEKACGSLLEMIAALAPKMPGIASLSPDQKEATSEGIQEHTEPKDRDWLTPKLSWERSDYEMAFFYNTLLKKPAEADDISQLYLSTESARQRDNEITWAAFREYTHVRFGEGGNFATLLAMGADNPNSSGILELVGRGYEHYKENAEAARSYEAAAKVSVEPAQLLRLLGLAAIAHATRGSKEHVTLVTDLMREAASADIDLESVFLDALRQIAEVQKDDALCLAIMERLSEVTPGDTGLLFSLAYKHSECGNHDLALLHYNRIPNRERNATTWNNLGASFSSKSLSAKSVAAYKKAKDMGETLAMSNLAYKYIGEGFLGEAQQECDAALAISKYHKNIILALARIREVPDEEDTKLKDILDKSLPSTEFYRSLGRALVRPCPANFPKNWDGPKCVLKAQLDGHMFTAVGSYDQPTNALLAYALMGGQNSPGVTTERIFVEYSGVLRGRMIEGKVLIRRDGEARPTLLGTTGEGNKISMFLTDDDNELQVMEHQGSSLRFYSLRRLDNRAIE